MEVHNLFAPNKKFNLHSTLNYGSAEPYATEFGLIYKFHIM